MRRAAGLRTRSPRWRAGSRANKRHRAVHTLASDRRRPVPTAKRGRRR